MRVKCECFDMFGTITAAKAINDFITENKIKKEDVITIMRGGGGLELWYWGEL